jgi:hypothetical protein
MNIPNKTYCKNCKDITEHRQKMDAVKNGNIVCNTCDVENPFRFPSYTPDRWVIVKLEGKDTHYRVFGSWAGGYLHGDSWRMNSGIVRVEEDLENYYFYGHSGSCYKCHKKCYGVMTSYSGSVLDNMVEKSKAIERSMIVLEDQEDWTQIKF